MSLHPSVQQPDTILRYADRAIVTFEVFEPSIGFARTDEAITPRDHSSSCARLAEQSASTCCRSGVWPALP